MAGERRRPSDLPGDHDALARDVESIGRLLATGLPRFLFGQIDTGGNVTRGTGFTSVRNSLGNYTVTFTQAFTNAPVADLTPIGGVIARLVGSPTTTAMTISTLNSSFANADADTSFIVIGT